MESARLATPADRSDLAHMWAALGDEMTAQRGGAVLAATLAPDAAADLAVDDPSRFVAVGCIDGVTVGFVSARLDAHAAPPVAVIDALYVDAGAREIGVGESMTDLVVAWAAALGCRGVDASALPGNRKAKAFFEDNGFVARVLVMHRTLASPSTGEALRPDAAPGAAAEEVRG
jgi:GNAT superfamily N-acetyltransferase